MIAMANSKPFVLTRTFDAPRALVWEVFTKAEHLKHWMGPAGALSHATVELKPGGVFHYGMAMPNGHVMWGKWTFVEIVPPQKLVVIVAFSDENQGITTHPMAPTWPRETHSVTTFTEKDGKTTLRLEWTAYQATGEEQATFDAAHDSMTGGWTGTMDALDAYLKTLRK
jgi:uncharacterized protein YndB with AHSA1/START domain